MGNDLEIPRFRSRHCWENGKTFFQHLRFVLGVSLSCLRMAFILAVHGLFPDWRRFDGHLQIFLDRLMGESHVSKCNPEG